MFIRWTKEVLNEWYHRDANSDIVQILFFLWSVGSWIVTGAALFDKNAVFVREHLFPVALITGIIPSLMFIFWRVGIRIYALYLDYSYFVANGGKRKRDD